MTGTLRRKLYRGQHSRNLESHSQKPGHERWLVSYADFMTLLMAFFVVMYSVSQVSEEQYRVLSDTLSKAFKSDENLEAIIQEGEPQLSHTPTPIDLDGRALEDRPGNDANDVPETMTRLGEQLEQSFQQLVENNVVEVAGDERWLQIALPSEVLFERGGVSLSSTAQALIAEVSAALAPLNNVVQVEGFTDNVPVSGGSFGSNWELSSARAAAVVRQMVESGVAPERLAAVGYGEYQPVASNQTEEGRRQNRRIVLMVSTREQFRDDTFREPQIEYGGWQELPAGTLVRGLDQNVIEQAEAWLSARYPSVSGAQQNDDAIEQTSQEALVDPNAGNIRQIQLDDGTLIFTENQ